MPAPEHEEVPAREIDMFVFVCYLEKPKLLFQQTAYKLQVHDYASCADSKTAVFANYQVTQMQCKFDTEFNSLSLQPPHSFS